MTKILFDELLLHYAEAMSTEELPILAQLNRETYQKVLQPIMLSGHLQGAFLQMMSKIMQTKRILDIGTFTGYSAICLAQGLDGDGQVHTIEIDEEKSEIAQKYFEASGLKNKIIPHYGHAVDILKELRETWDIVFIDADKTNYSAYFDLVFDQVRLGGLIIADNVLYEGKVLQPISEQGKNEKAIHAFNHKIKADKRVEVLMLPIRDGLSVIRKIAH